MRTEYVDVPTPDGISNAYLTRPDDDGRHPGVLLIMDAFGLRPRIEEMADRIAAAGYAVLAPNAFYRAGRSPVGELPDLTDPEQRGTFMERVRPLMAELTAENAARDGGAYLDYLAELAPGPVAITGYCMGGRFGWYVAAAHPDRVAALGGFHVGGLVTDEPGSPHNSADRIEAEVYLGHADEDASNTPEQIATVEAALAGAGVTHGSELYPGAAHGYTMADTAAYDEEATERHFRALFDLLDRAL